MWGALQLMLIFGTFVINLIALVIEIIALIVELIKKSTKK
ncbi:putative holin-like toxin [Lactobacillus acetotolerans]